MQQHIEQQKRMAAMGLAGSEGGVASSLGGMAPTTIGGVPSSVAGMPPSDLPHAAVTSSGQPFPGMPPGAQPGMTRPPGMPGHLEGAYSLISYIIAHLDHFFVF